MHFGVLPVHSAQAVLLAKQPFSQVCESTNWPLTQICSLPSSQRLSSDLHAAHFWPSGVHVSHVSGSLHLPSTHVVKPFSSHFELPFAHSWQP